MKTSRQEIQVGGFGFVLLSGPDGEEVYPKSRDRSGLTSRSIE